MRKMFASSSGTDKIKHTEEEMDQILDSLSRVCNTQCSVSTTEGGRHSGQHMIRASVRDAEGRRYLFVCDEGEAWKMAGSVIRLRKGSQARMLAVDGMGTAEASLIMTKLRGM